jgi:CDGSH-type Zn-finger protein
MADCQITCRDNGPLLLEGTFTLKDMAGNAFDLGGRTKIALCRCGASQDAPFCDGSHKGCNFASQVKARALPPKP